MIYCKNIAVIEEPLYYYQRGDSACGEYRPQEILGAIKTSYLYNKRFQLLKQSNIEECIYKPLFKKLWSTFLPLQAIHVTHPLHPYKKNEKKKFLANVIKECEIKKTLE